MAPPKKTVLKALGDPHLRAIGLVAAQWSSLEFSAIWAVAQEFKIKLSHAIILAGAQNASAWCDMLRKLTNPPIVKGAPKKKTPLDVISSEIAELLTLRNHIVHTTWDERSAPIIAGARGALSLVHEEMASKRRLKAAEKATGSGIPKRGSDIVILHEFSAKEMLVIADRIAAVEKKLLAWSHRRRLAEALRAGPKKP